jgi:hypothetical protein
MQLFFSEFRKYKFKEQLKTNSLCTVQKKNKDAKTKDLLKSVKELVIVV